jgi:ribulose-phosphate 3-epimerase
MLYLPADKRSIRLSPSLLSANAATLGADAVAALAAGGDRLHYDVMDGRFVPNITFGMPVLAQLRAHLGPDAFLDAHLMIVEPERYVEAFAKAGANQISIHVEASPHLHRTIQLIRATGAHVGVAINPATPLSALYEVLDCIDTVLMMTVNPGFGGQQYIPQSTAKIRTLRAYIAANGLTTQIQVDGGIGIDTLATVAAAGVDDVVVGSAFFRPDGNLRRSIDALQACLNG